MNLYITNVGHKVTDESLAVVLSTYGSVRSSAIHAQDPSQGPGRTARVTMASREEAEFAVQKLHGKYIDGRAICVVLQESRMEA